MKRVGSFARSQRLTIANAVLLFVILVVVLQLWLFTATMNAYLGGDYGMAAPAAGVSLVCLLLIVGLLRYVYRLDR